MKFFITRNILRLPEMLVKWAVMVQLYSLELGVLRPSVRIRFIRSIADEDWPVVAPLMKKKKA